MSEESGQATENDAPPASWVEGFNPELKGYVETKGFKDPAALATAYQNLEKLRGVPAERLLTLPDNTSDAEAMAPIYAKLGRPEDATGYKNVLGDEFNDDVYKAAAAKAHELGLGGSQFEGMQAIMKEQAEAITAKQEEQAAAAFDDWRGKNAEGYANAARVMASVGVDEQALANVLAGDKSALYDFLSKVASRSAEGKTVHGDEPESAGFNLTPQAARLKISEKLGDKAFVERYTSSNAQVRQSAIEEMERLQKMAAAT